MELKDRLRKARKNAGLTQTKVAQSIGGMTQPSYSGLERGDSKSTTKIAEIAQLFGVSPIWLATGEGDMKPRDGIPMSNVKYKEIEVWEGDTPLEDGEVEIPYYKDVEFLGGDGRTEQYDSGRRRIKYATTAFSSAGSSMKDSICLTLRGDSMADKIADGSMIAIDKSKTTPREGKIFAFRHGEMLRVKYLLPRPDGGLVLRSHNKAYEDEVLSPDEVQGDIEIIGWVWNWSSLERW